MKIFSFGSRLGSTGTRLATCARLCLSLSIVFMSSGVMARIASMPCTAFLIILIPSDPVAKRTAQTFASLAQRFDELISASLISASLSLVADISCLREITDEFPTLTKAKNRSLYSRMSHSAPLANTMS